MTKELQKEFMTKAVYAYEAMYRKTSRIAMVLAAICIAISFVPVLKNYGLCLSVAMLINLALQSGRYRKYKMAVLCIKDDDDAWLDDDDIKRQCQCESIKRKVTVGTCLIMSIITFVCSCLMIAWLKPDSNIITIVMTGIFFAISLFLITSYFAYRKVLLASRAFEEEHGIEAE